MSFRTHKGPLFPDADKRNRGYQDEHTYPGGYIHAWDSEKLGPHEFRPRNDKREYEFFFRKHTDNSIHLTLRIHRSDIIEQRKENGFAIEYEDYSTTLSFGQLMNRIFSPGCDVWEHTEALPDSIKKAMKNAYGNKE